MLPSEQSHSSAQAIVPLAPLRRGSDPSGADVILPRELHQPQCPAPAGSKAASRASMDGHVGVQMPTLLVGAYAYFWPLVHYCPWRQQTQDR